VSLNNAGYLEVDGQTVVDLDVVAHQSANGGKYTAFHVNGIGGDGCNYHALVIPPSSSGAGQ
jgi:hypothetical protein